MSDDNGRHERILVAVLTACVALWVLGIVFALKLFGVW